MPHQPDATFANCRFRNGETLPQLRLRYATLGQPHRARLGQEDERCPPHQNSCMFLERRPSGENSKESDGQAETAVSVCSLPPQPHQL
jgi:hypothetical protein